MSTDLELCQELPKIKVSSIRVRTQQVSESAEIPKQNFKGQGEGDEEEDKLEDSECPRTPTSKEHKIPALLTCPPAPRKPKMRVVPCKRKLTELKFFEIVKREEVESFFRSSFQVISNGSSAKRTCCSCK